MTFSLSPRSVELILAEHGRRNSDKFDDLRIGDRIEHEDIGKFDVVDLVSNDNYSSYDEYDYNTRQIILKDEDDRLFSVTVEDSSYSSTISVLSAKMVVAKPVDRTDYITVKH